MIDDTEKIIKLMELAKLGDKTAFDQLYQNLLTPVYRYVYLRIQNKATAEDLTQVVFLKAFQSIGSFEDQGRPVLTYFFTIARNTVIDHYRKKQPLLDDEGEQKLLSTASRNEDPQRDILKIERQSDVLKALQLLPEEQKEALVLKFINDLPNSEIARLLNKNEVAIRQIQSRGLRKLRQLLQDNF